MTTENNQRRQPPAPTNVFRIDEGGVVEAIPLDGSSNPELSVLPPVKPCRLYLPGHHVHPIQAKLAFQSEPTQATILKVRDKLVTLKINDRIVTARNHRSENLKQALLKSREPLHVWLYDHYVMSFEGSLWCLEFRHGDRFRNWKECR